MVNEDEKNHDMECREWPEPSSSYLSVFHRPVIAFSVTRQSGLIEMRDIRMQEVAESIAFPQIHLEDLDSEPMA